MQIRFPDCAKCGSVHGGPSHPDAHQTMCCTSSFNNIILISTYLMITGLHFAEVSGYSDSVRWPAVCEQHGEGFGWQPQTESVQCCFRHVSWWPTIKIIVPDFFFFLFFFASLYFLTERYETQQWNCWISLIINFSTHYTMVFDCRMPQMTRIN